MRWDMSSMPQVNDTRGNQSVHILMQELGSVLCLDCSLHTLLDKYIELLVNHFEARCGFYTPFWFEELSLVSSLRVFKEEAWSGDDAELDALCERARKRYAAYPDDTFLYDGDDDPFICLRLADNGHPEMWLIIALEKPLSDEALNAFVPLVSWFQNGMVQCRRKTTLDSTQTRIDEMTRGMAETMAQLVQAEKMSELGKLTAGIAHEINNPIGYIRSNLETLVQYVETFEELFAEIAQWAKTKPGCSEMLQELEAKYDLSFLLEDAHEIVATNVSGIDRIRDIVSDLYAFSRKGEGKMMPLSLQDVIQRCVKLTKTRFDNHHQIQVDVHTDTPYCVGDASQLEQVMINMMINAAHAMPAGGVLSLDLSSTENRLILKVKDTGVGMDKVTQQKIFSPFFTTKPTGVGTGLGLSISHGILQAHNATVSVESAINEGTEFTLSFPLYRESSD